MKLIVDGKEIPYLNDVKVVFDEDDVGVHFTFTKQGVVQDWVSYDDLKDPLVIASIQNDVESLVESVTW
jgi:hypothetical protein